MVSLYRGLPRQVYVLSVARLIAAMGMFIYPFLSLFLNSKMGFSELEIGKYMLVIAAANISGSLLSGKLADRFGRKRTYLWSMGLCVMFLALSGFLCDRLVVIFLVGAVYFFVSMTMPVLAAMITDVAEPSQRRECFSILYLSTNIGLSVGPLIAGLLFPKYVAWIFWGQGISFFLAFLLVLLFAEETQPDLAAAEDRVDVDVKAKNKDEGLLSIVLRSPMLLMFILCVAALCFCYIQVDFMLPLYVKDLFGLETGSRYFGVISAANGVAVVLLTSAVIVATGKLRPITNIALASIFYAAGFGLYAVTRQFPLLVLLVFVWTTGEILISTSSGVYIAERAPITHRARFQSLYELAQGLGKGVAPAIMGYYLEEHTISEGWVLIAVISLATGAVLLGLSRLDRSGRA